MSEALILSLEILVVFMMIGVIWTVQLVIYPLFRCYLDRPDEATNNAKELMWLHACYTPKISYVVIPLMFSELGLSLFHVFKWPTSFSIVGFLMVLGNWAFTFFLSVPLHQKLSETGDIPSSKKLVSTNWPRTILWNSRGLFLLFWWQSLQ